MELFPKCRAPTPTGRPTSRSGSQHRVGTWTSPGDSGDKRGVYTQLVELEGSQTAAEELAVGATAPSSTHAHLERDHPRLDSHPHSSACASASPSTAGHPGGVKSRKGFATTTRTSSCAYTGAVRDAVGGPKARQRRAHAVHLCRRRKPRGTALARLCPLYELIQPGRRPAAAPSRAAPAYTGAAALRIPGRRARSTISPFDMTATSSQRRAPPTVVADEDESQVELARRRRRRRGSAPASRRRGRRRSRRNDELGSSAMTRRCRPAGAARRKFVRKASRKRFRSRRYRAIRRRDDAERRALARSNASSAASACSLRSARI